MGLGAVLQIITVMEKEKFTTDDFWVHRQYIMRKSGIKEQCLDSILNELKDQNNYSYFESLKKNNIRVVVYGDNDYPVALTELAIPPLILYCMGSQELTRDPSIAVVGTRRCTPYGVRATKVLVKELLAQGAKTIISGMMYGIDEVAHQAALDESGRTIAVLGYGFGKWYPAGSKRLAEAIVQNGGLLITEYPPGLSPNKGTFLARNRIVAALAQATLVIEAGERSGTQRTVAVAAELGRTVGAVPGPFDSPYSQGTKAFINQGALLVTEARDLLDELGLETSGTVAQRDNTMTSVSPVQREILNQLQAGPQSSDELCATLSLTVVQLSFELSCLELTGRIVRRGAEWYLLI